MNVTVQFTRKATAVSEGIPLDFHICNNVPLPRVGDKVIIKKRLYIVEEVLHDYQTVEDDTYSYTEVVINVVCKRIVSYVGYPLSKGR